MRNYTEFPLYSFREMREARYYISLLTSKNLERKRLDVQMKVLLAMAGRDQEDYKWLEKVRIFLE